MPLGKCASPLQALNDATSPQLHLSQLRKQLFKRLLAVQPLATVALFYANGYFSSHLCQILVVPLLPVAPGAAAPRSQPHPAMNSGRLSFAPQFFAASAAEG
jgi:hypothetical protein